MARWADVVGDEVAARCTPERFADGVLVVRAATTAWATQLTYLTGDLRRRLAEVVGDGVVHRIEVVGPAAPSWRRGRLRVTGTRGPRDTYG
jgi:predicted nucleic acid-binding Zn ribbon protein